MTQVDLIARIHHSQKRTADSGIIILDNEFIGKMLDSP